MALEPAKRINQARAVEGEINDFVLPLDAFVRSVRVKRSTPHALFIGAGSSISSGVPSAEKCIWEWKRSIFLTSNPGMEDLTCG